MPAPSVALAVCTNPLVQALAIDYSRNSITLNAREGGENPPLPRNCKRRVNPRSRHCVDSVDAGRRAHFGAASQETDSAQTATFSEGERSWLRPACLCCLRPSSMCSRSKALLTPKRWLLRPMRLRHVFRTYISPFGQQSKRTIWSPTI